MTGDVLKTRIKAHQGNIERYRQLLPLKLTPTEREFVKRRIAEEKTSIRRLKGELKYANEAASFGNPRRAPGPPRRDWLARL